MCLSDSKHVSLEDCFSLQIKEFTSKPVNSVIEPKGKWSRIPGLEARQAPSPLAWNQENVGPDGLWVLRWHSSDTLI